MMHENGLRQDYISAAHFPCNVTSIHYTEVCLALIGVLCLHRVHYSYSTLVTASYQREFTQYK